MIKVSSILIGVADLNKSKPFYEEILGMTFDEFRPPFASAKSLLSLENEKVSIGDVIVSFARIFFEKKE